MNACLLFSFLRRCGLLQDRMNTHACIKFVSCLAFYWFIAQGVNPALAAADERTKPKLPVTDDTSKIQNQVNPEDTTVTDSKAEIIPELKGLIFMTDSKDLQSAPKPEKPILIKNLPLLENPEILSKLQAYIGQPLSFAVMGKINKLISDWYISHDDPLVDVTYPTQNITSGYLQAIVTRSLIGSIRAEGNKWFSSESLLTDLQINPGDHLQQSVLEDDLYALNANPFRKVEGLLAKGESQGTTDIILKTTDRNPLRLYGGYDNSGSPTTGRSRWNLGANYGDAFGRGDIVSYQFTSSSDFWISDDHFLNNAADPKFAAHSISYTAFLPWHDTVTVYGAYSRSHPALDQNFTQIGQGGQAGINYTRKSRPQTTDIGEYAQQLSATYDFKTTNNNLDFGGTTVVNGVGELNQFTLGYSGTLKDNYGQTYLENALTLSPGDLTAGNTNQALEEMGVSFAKARYVYNRVDLNRKTTLPENFVWGSRFRGQISTTNLLSSENLGSSAYDGVRGYFNQPSGSNGYIISQEIYPPPFSPLKLLGMEEQDHLQPLLFWDFARFYDVKKQPQSFVGGPLQSIGLGLAYNYSNYFSANLTYGKQLEAQKGYSRANFLAVNVVISY